MSYFLALLTAHLCGDILFNGSYFSKSKRSDKHLKKAAGLTVHCLIHAVLVLIVFYVLSLNYSLRAASMIFLIHSLIDFARPYYEEKIIPRRHFVAIGKRDFFRWLSNRGGISDVSQFMEDSLVRWSLVIIGDQSLHLISLFTISYMLAQ